MSLCSCDTNLTKASPLRLPCGDKQSATPPLMMKTKKNLINNFYQIQHKKKLKLK